MTQAATSQGAEPNSKRNLRGDEVHVAYRGQGDAGRVYTLRTTHPPRKGTLAGAREIREPPRSPRTRTGDVLFDALFALALKESREASVSSIRTDGFNKGQPTPCECFETGAEWTYVWTRDTAYAMQLALGSLDPTRAISSLSFKLSGPKPGFGAREALQVVQDTGTGGSWPNSTDRVTWFLGARAALAATEGAAHAAFRARVLTALENTLRVDREMVFDEASGLYRGEQSFLDWREQTYPIWMKHQPVAIAASRSSSTNVVHLAALRLAEALSRQSARTAEADRYRAEAEALRSAIVRTFWDAEAGQLRALLGPPPSDTRYASLDLLGVSLAVLEDVLTPAQAEEAVARYPRLPIGSPVVWPQTPDRAIYHNRGIWPFVSAFSALAAKKVGNEAVFDHDMDTLLERAALNLSNMENFDALTGSNNLREGPQKGPVINSRRQLWSVAGFLGAVIEGVFGLVPTQDGVLISPFITPGLHRRWLGGRAEAALLGLALRGRRLDAVVHVPAVEHGVRYFEAERVLVNGRPIEGHLVPWGQLDEENRIEVWLRAVKGPRARMRLVEPGEGFDPAVFAPREPAPPSLTFDGPLITLRGPVPPAGVIYHLLRNGQRIASHTDAFAWQEERDGNQGTCFELVAEHQATGLASHPSEPLCVGIEPELRFAPRTMKGRGVRKKRRGDRVIVEGFGARRDDRIELTFKVVRDGRYRLGVEYGNGLGIPSGIAAGVKRFSLGSEDGKAPAQTGVLVMPQLRKDHPFGPSTVAFVDLRAGMRYHLTISDGFNMSYLEHFTAYDGEGGGPTAVNRIDVAAVTLSLWRAGGAP